MTTMISSFLIHHVGRVWEIGIVVAWGPFYLNIDMVYEIRMYNLFALNIAQWTHSIVMDGLRAHDEEQLCLRIAILPSLLSYSHPCRCEFLQQSRSYIFIHYFPRLFDFGCTLFTFSVVWPHSLIISEGYLENLILISSPKYFYYRTAWP